MYIASYEVSRRGRTSGIFVGHIGIFFNEGKRWIILQTFSENVGKYFNQIFWYCTSSDSIYINSFFKVSHQCQTHPSFTVDYTSCTTNGCLRSQLIIAFTFTGAASVNMTISLISANLGKRDPNTDAALQNCSRCLLIISPPLSPVLICKCDDPRWSCLCLSRWSATVLIDYIAASSPSHGPLLSFCTVNGER